MSRSCVCGGANENCRFCNGSGVLPDLLGSALVNSVQRVASERLGVGTSRVRAGLVSHRGRRRGTSSPINLIRCPEGCGAFLNPRKVARHLSKMHGHPSAVPQKPEGSELPKESPKGVKPQFERQIHAPSPLPQSLGVPTTNLGAPAAGQSEMTREQLLARIAQLEAAQSANRSKRPVASKVHSNAASIRPNIDTAVRHFPNWRKVHSAFEVCPFCKVKLKASRFEKHLRKVHGKRVSRSATATSAKDPTRENTTLVAPRDKNLDATKPYAHAYREQGKFGSHPSHDGFDDESSPD